MVISLCCQKSSIQQFRDGLVTVMTENQTPYDFALLLIFQSQGHLMVQNGYWSTIHYI